MWLVLFTLLVRMGGRLLRLLVEGRRMGVMGVVTVVVEEVGIEVGMLRAGMAAAGLGILRLLLGTGGGAIDLLVGREVGMVEAVGVRIDAVVKRGMFMCMVMLIL